MSVNRTDMRLLALLRDAGQPMAYDELYDALRAPRSYRLRDGVRRLQADGYPVRESEPSVYAYEPSWERT